MVKIVVLGFQKPIATPAGTACTFHTFRPGAAAMRAQIAKIVYLALGSAGMCGGAIRARRLPH